MTAWWLPDDCLMTAWWLPDDCLKTSWWLPDNYLMTVWWMSDDFMMTAWWLPDDCLMNVRWQSDDFKMNAWWMSDDYQMTFWWLHDDCQLTAWFCSKLQDDKINYRLLRLPKAVKSIKRWRSRRGQRAWHTDPDICKWIVLSIMIMLITRSSIWLWWWDIIAYFYRHGNDVWLLGKHMCDNYVPQWWVKLSDELSWFFSNRLSATR